MERKKKIEVSAWLYDLSLIAIGYMVWDIVIRIWNSIM